MDTTSIDESTTSTDSTTITPASLFPSPPTKSPPLPESLGRVGSGASVVLDSENGVEAESRKLPSSKYKGVVPQPNGRWGAQIYEKHQRVWLGTFNEEEEAARAYDTAAQRFRGRDAVTNFKPLSETDEADIEITFLNSHSKAEIVDMLRKHTYSDEFMQCKRNYQKGVNGMKSRTSNRVLIKAREQLFEKAVTPSDVGKLNRLVIPKQHAEKYFPLQGGNTSSKGVLLNFEDIGGKVWRFRYSYWSSSQSYVLTKGWSRFVKEKFLKAGDVVSFQRSTGLDKQLYIDFKVRSSTTNTPESFKPVAGYPNSIQPVQVMRLFGVNIFQDAIEDNGGGGVEICNDKRMRDMEFSLDCSKKQRIVGAL